jgi:D-alanyl-D-alanine carboxypeptidase
MRAARHILLLLPFALAACGGGGPRIVSRPPSGAVYRAPGPPGDPWGPYIAEASQRYNVPQTWIRAVMQQESGGHQYLNGQPTTSSSGAMGLMQLMPATYAVLRDRNGFGDDPYDPHDNIMAGTALIADLYAKYGSPAFLAAYNSSPRTLDAYLAGQGSLPNETVTYMASVAPRLGGPMTGPLAAYAGQGTQPAPEPVQVAEASEPAPPPYAPTTATTAGATLWGPGAAPVTAAPLPAPAPPPPPPRHTGFALIPRAYADTPPPSRTDARWGVQVGAFSDPSQARQVADNARSVAPAQLAPAATVVGSVTHPDGQTFYRARLIGITEPAADSACGTLVAQRWACLTVPPGG